VRRSSQRAAAEVAERLVTRAIKARGLRDDTSCAFAWLHAFPSRSSPLVARGRLELRVANGHSSRSSSGGSSPLSWSPSAQRHNPSTSPRVLSGPSLVSSPFSLCSPRRSPLSSYRHSPGSKSSHEHGGAASGDDRSPTEPVVLPAPLVLLVPVITSPLWTRRQLLSEPKLEADRSCPSPVMQTIVSIVRSGMALGASPPSPGAPTGV